MKDKLETALFYVIITVILFLMGYSLMSIPKPKKYVDVVKVYVECNCDRGD